MKLVQKKVRGEDKNKTFRKTRKWQRKWRKTSILDKYLYCVSRYDCHVCCGLMEYHACHSRSGGRGWVRAHSQPRAPRSAVSCLPWPGVLRRVTSQSRKQCSGSGVTQHHPAMCVLDPHPPISRGAALAGGGQGTLMGQHSPALRDWALSLSFPIYRKELTAASSQGSWAD